MTTTIISIYERSKERLIARIQIGSEPRIKSPKQEVSFWIQDFCDTTHSIEVSIEKEESKQ